MKILIALLLSAIAASPASAALVKYRYTASVYEMFEWDNATSTISYVDSSSMAGAHFQVGDVYTGSFSYDTELGLSAYQPDVPQTGTYRMYQGYIVSSWTDLQNGFTYQSDPNPSLASMQVANDASTFYGGDIVSFSTNGLMTPLRFDITDFMFMDSSGTALSAGTPPTVLDLAHFLAETTYSFVRPGDMNQMVAKATITNLEAVNEDQSNVPEPGTFALLFVGVAGLFASGRKRGS